MLPLARYTLNSLFVAAVAVPLTLVVASWAGFAMAQQRERTRKRLMIFSLTILLIPLTTLWLTRFILFKWLGLINTPFALIVPALAGSSPLFVLLFYWTFRRIPKDLFESARLDGAGALIVWRRIALPMAVPTTVAVGVLAFLFYWSDFINPLMYLRSQEFYTLPVGLQQLQQLDKTNWPLLMAGAVLMAGPAVVMFLFVQRYFLRDNRMIGSDGR
jgi:multiple sugar transport system permease protein